MELTVKELLDLVTDYQQEISGTLTKEDVASHKTIRSRVLFRLNDDRFEGTITLKEIYPSMLPGCGCWDGMVFDLEFTAE